VPKVRTVTLDLWGTLLLDSPGSDNRYQRRRVAGLGAILRDEGFDFSVPELMDAYDASGHYLQDVWSTGRDVPVVEHVRAMLRALDEALAREARPALLTALVEAYASPALLAPPAVDDSARAALAHLREAGIALAIVSNTMRTPGAILRRLLARFELLDHFDYIVFSDEVGVRKPQPDIFLRALRAVGGEVESAVHVGDDPVLDVAGARAVGLRVVQVVGGSAGTPPAADRPDRTITRLGELPAAIMALDAE
jgi:putative hydrolase of the HAD superfamily